MTFYLFISPWLVGFALLMLWLMLVSIRYAFSDFSALDKPTHIGLANFREMLGDGQFCTALYNTFYFVFLSVPLQVVISLLLAVHLNQRIRGVWLFRTGFYLPTVVPAIAAAVFDGLLGMDV
ncbi:MAG: hypothetical protein AB1774_00660 [Bacillota bacterium]